MRLTDWLRPVAGVGVGDSAPVNRSLLTSSRRIG